jgi:hypothetical protein
VISILQPLPARALVLLLEHAIKYPGRVLDREEFCKQLWPDKLFDTVQHNLRRVIATVCEGLGQAGRELIPFERSTSTRSYKFVGRVQPVLSSAAQGKRMPFCIGAPWSLQKYAEALQTLLSPSQSYIVDWDGTLTDFDDIQAHAEQTQATVLLVHHDDQEAFDRLLAQLSATYGLCRGIQGHSRVFLGTMGAVPLPAHLAAARQLRLDYQANMSTEDFQLNNTKQVTLWRERLEKQPPQTLHERFPETYSALRELEDYYWARPQRKHIAAAGRPLAQLEADRTLAQVLAATHPLLMADPGLVELLQRQRGALPTCRAIGAVDGGGPPMWIRAAHYAYLGEQIKHYRDANMSAGQLKAKWTVSPELHAAITRVRPSILNHDTSKTKYRVCSSPLCEYSRILRWTPEQLSHPITALVITIHETHDVPLFFLATSEDEQEDLVSFIFYKQADGTVSGSHLRQGDSPPYAPRVIEDSIIPPIGDVLKLYYQTYLQDPKLQWAKDAYEALRFAWR